MLRTFSEQNQVRLFLTIGTDFRLFMVMCNTASTRGRTNIEITVYEPTTFSFTLGTRSGKKIKSKIAC